MRKILKGVFTAVISFALTLLTVVAGIFPATISVSAEEREVAYEQTNVLDDLKGSTINGKAFSLMDYNFDSKKETQVISFVEYCYSFYQNLQDNYGLYIYLYNPKGLKFMANSPLNKIQMSHGLNASQSYVKYPLEFLNCSTETNYEGLFYKFKIVMTGAQKQALLQDINSSDRVYRVSGIEILEQGKVNATEYRVATTYHFSGYSTGYGSSATAGNTLKMDSEQGEVLTLNVHPATYRPSGTNGVNKYTQDSLHSVYFAVPNDVINNYGAMTAVHATWLNAVLKPALVTGNKSAYDAILPQLGKELSVPNTTIGYKPSEIDYMYLGAYKKRTAAFGMSQYSYDYSYNCGVDTFINALDENYTRVLDGIGENINPLYMMFYAGSGTDSADKFTVPTETMLARLKETKRKYGGALVNDKYSYKVFESVDEEFTEVNIRAGEEYSLTSEKISSTWWEKLWGSEHVESSKVFDGIKAIYAVQEEDLVGTVEEVSERLYISQNDYGDFKKYYDANKNFCTVYLFRYQVSDYMAQEATLMKGGDDWLGNYEFKKEDTNAYFFKETVNLDFDIIDVTFSNGSRDTVIPVVSNPIDIVPSPTPPVYTETDKKLDWKMIALAVVGVIILVICLPKILVGLVKGLFELIGAFVKWLGSLFKGE